MTRTIVVGAGMTGLSTAWHLQEYGHEVEVLERIDVAAGSSWGNAGWLAPGKTIPLSNSSLWAYGPTALFDKHAALDVPVRIPASRFKDYVADPQAVVRALQRPMPD